MSLLESKIGIIYLQGGGLVSLYLNYALLDNVTLVDWRWSVLFYGVPTLIGAVYMVRIWEVHKSESYKDVVKGLKLQLIKALLIFFITLWSFMLFGGYLNTLVLGMNYLFREQDTEIAAYEVVEVHRYQSHRKSRPERFQITLTNGSLTNTYQIPTRSLPDFNYQTDDFALETRTGLLGWEVIEKVHYRKAE